MNRVELHAMIVQSFDDNELRDLCFRLGIDYESLPGDGKAAKARELVAYCERHDRIGELETAARRLADDLAQGRPLQGAPRGQPTTVFDMRGQQVGTQINVEGDYIDQSVTLVGGSDAAQLDAMGQEMRQGFDDLKRGQKAIYTRLSQSQQQTVDEVLAGLRAMRLDDAESAREMRGMLDGIRRALDYLQSRQLPELSDEMRSTLKEVTEVVRVETDVKNGLEWTIPLIPALLNYKINVDLGGGLDLRQWWENLLARIRRR